MKKIGLRWSDAGQVQIILKQKYVLYVDILARLAFIFSPLSKFLNLTK